MIAHWAVPVVGVEPHRVKLSYLHAVTSRWLDGREDHGKPGKAWSLTPMIDVDGVPALHVITLSEAGFDALATSRLAGKQIRLGSQNGTIVADATIIEERGLTDLMNAPVRRAHCVSFLTPTALRSGSRTSPLLDPYGVANSLTRRWNSLMTHPDLQLSAASGRNAWVSDIDGHNTVLRMHSITVSGFVGRMRFEYSDHDSATLFSRLWALAEHAGLGAYTTSGLGCIEVEETWQSGDSPVLDRQR